jgi:hypothetical protein
MEQTAQRFTHCEKPVPTGCSTQMTLASCVQVLAPLRGRSLVLR